MLTDKEIKERRYGFYLGLFTGLIIGMLVPLFVSGWIN